MSSLWYSASNIRWAPLVGPAPVGPIQCESLGLGDIRVNRKLKPVLKIQHVDIKLVRT